MKLARFACQCLFVIAPVFIAPVFGQSNNVSLDNQPTETVAQPSVSQPILKARSTIQNGDGKLPLSFEPTAPKATAARRRAASMSASLFANEYTYSSGGTAPIFVTLADVNGDGKLDLLAANSGTSPSSVGVLLGNGDGTFQPTVAYGSGGSFAYSVAVADVNGDGKPDLLVANKCAVNDNCGGGDGEVGVLLGNGDGTFQAAVSYDSGGNWAYSVAVADINGDGKPDLLVANQCGSSSACDAGSLAVLLGNGDGTFRPAVTYSSGGLYANTVAVADVNGDGKPDVVVTNGCVDRNCHNGIVSVFLGNGDGTFQSAVMYSSAGYSAESLAVVDLNGDGKPDLVVTNLYISNVAVLLGNGDGTFQPAVAYRGNSSYSLAVADVNGDGKPDIVVANYSLEDIGVLLGNGDGTFQAETTYQNYFPAYAVAVGDLNGDGRPEVLVANTTSLMEGGTVGVLMNTSLRATTTALASSSNPSNYGQNVTFTATVTPTPASGKVIFVDGTNILATPSLSGGTATYSTATFTIGRHNISAIYSGGSASAALPQDVNVAVSTTTLMSSINPSKPMQPVTFTATVSSQSPAGTPTGTVRFLNGTIVLATKTLAAGSATFITYNLPVGSNIITAVYSGDSSNNGSTSAPLNQIVLATTTTMLTSSPNPSAYGQSVLFTATVTSSSGPPPNGETVTFKEGTTVLGTGTLSSGSAKFSTSTLRVGTNAVLAVYAGDGNFEASTSKADSQVVSKATSTTTLISSLNPSIFGQSVTFTATVAPQFSGTPTGTVIFKNGTVGLKEVTISNGVAAYTTTTLAVGNASITAVYSGSTSFASSTSAPVSQVVNQASTTTTLVSSVNLSNYKQTVTFTATVTAQDGVTVSGTVTFQDGTTTLSTVTVSGGVAKLADATLASGTHNITATYNGNSDFTTSSASLTQTVN